MHVDLGGLNYLGWVGMSDDRESLKYTEKAILANLIVYPRFNMYTQGGCVSGMVNHGEDVAKISA